MPREDRDAAKIVQAALKRDGVQVLCCGKNLELSREGNGVRMKAESHGKGYGLVVDKLLSAAGRAPNVEGLGLDTAGVELDRNGVKVNDRLQTIRFCSRRNHYKSNCHSALQRNAALL